MKKFITDSDPPITGNYEVMNESGDVVMLRYSTILGGWFNRAIRVPAYKIKGWREINE